MSEQNGSEKAPAKAAAQNTAKVLHDVMTLAELQAELLKTEAQQRSRRAIKPLVVLVVALCVVLGCIPVLLLSLARFLTDIAAWSHSLSLLIAGAAAMFAAVTAAVLALPRIRGAFEFNQSKDELSRNVRWIKQMLKHECNPAHDDCGNRSKDLETADLYTRS